MESADTNQLQKYIVGHCIEHGEDALSGIIARGVKDKDFTNNMALPIWNLINERYALGEPFDEISLTPTISRDMMLDIMECTNLAFKYGTQSQLGNHCELLKDQTKKREIRRLGLLLSETAEDPSTEPEKMIALAEKKLLDISLHGNSKSVVNAKESADKAASSLLSRLEGKDEIYIPSGFYAIDSRISGFRNKNLYILAARPAKGKTALGLGIGKNIASSQKRTPVYWCSLEMGHDELSERNISSETGINLRKLDTGIYSHKKQEVATAIKQAAERLGNIPITFDDQPDLDIEMIRSRARHLKSQGKCEIIIVDYLQLIKYKGKDRIPRHEQLGYITGGLKQMAKELEIPVVALCQLNREIDKDIRPPRMSDLRESGSIEQDADCILMLWQKLLDEGGEIVDPDPSQQKEGYHARDEIGIVLAKFRQGDTDNFSMGFTKAFTRFSDNVPSRTPAKKPQQNNMI
jgi:replicative DNA helicase